MAKRVQLSRRLGWRMPENTVKVDRSTKFGNPYRVDVFGLDLSLELFARTVRGIWTPDGIPVELVPTAYDLHRAFLKKHNHHPLDNVRYELRGMDIACWCKLEEKCHGDVLLQIANA